jgi:hypothetical protein
MDRCMNLKLTECRISGYHTDDGGGMDPDSLRRCMSFGFSEKQSGSSIGQCIANFCSIISKSYPETHCLTFWHLSLWSDGNGFKTSTMRLGADVIVFSRCTKSRYHIPHLNFFPLWTTFLLSIEIMPSYYLFSVGLHNPLVSSLTLSWWKLDIQML